MNFLRFQIGKQGQLLRERCVSPEEFLEGENLELDSEYYINKILIPPLDRLFNLIGINVGNWAQGNSKIQKASTTTTKSGKHNKSRELLQHVVIVVEELTKICSLQLCDDCLEKKHHNLIISHKEIKETKEYENTKDRVQDVSYRYTSMQASKMTI
ncbi:AIF_HP2_G0052480.mRNA.1.CDS.1 [Saccharomyces cerevisiae]|nr:AIF_HP2_G0052480.mRNA.1.CDS.1 [Saccharomyces cerevisiae]CAI6798982.1 AIF_HP2_G0052480.mRNA.1.CDS.1 [Saccharomyces cerevisiae]